MREAGLTAGEIKHWCRFTGSAVAMPRDEYAIVQTKAMLKQTRLELEAGLGSAKSAASS